MSHRRTWIVVALVAAALYIAFGLVFAALAGSAASHQALVVWPLMLALPAYFVAVLALAGLKMVRQEMR